MSKPRIGLIGKGKTGGKVLELGSERYDIEIFDSKRPFSASLARELGLEAVVVFVAGEIFMETIPELLESNLPVVTGSTGFEFPPSFERFNEQLKDQGVTWIHGTNFSLGMRLIEEMINVLKQSSSLFTDYDFSLHEVHHTKKLDAPSGTALSWEKWLSEKVVITSERTGDVIGDHVLTLTTPFEKITLRHEALDRKIFASGALYAVDVLLHKKIEPGLYKFENFVKNENQRK